VDICKRYRGVVKNITVSLDDETYRRARIKAAELNKSVSSLVREFLIDMATTETETERLKREEQMLRATIGSFKSGDRLSRDAVHDRGNSENS
jgi:plasmid stability protein